MHNKRERIASEAPFVLVKQLPSGLQLAWLIAAVKSFPCHIHKTWCMLLWTGVEITGTSTRKEK